MPAPFSPGSRRRPSRRRQRFVASLLFAGLLFCVLTAATLAGLVPGLSSLAGTAGSADLGVRYDGSDLGSALKKLDGEAGTLDATLTEAELSAYLAHVSRRTEMPLGQVQLRVHAGNRFEISALAEYHGREYPIFAEGTALLRGADPGGSSVDTLRVAGLPRPGAERRRIEAAFEEQIARMLSEGQGVDVALLETQDGVVRIVGRRG